MISSLIDDDAIMEVVRTREPNYYVGNEGQSLDAANAVFAGWHFGSCKHATAYIHQFLNKDRADCFHTHNGAAFRYCAHGAYVEQMPDGSTAIFKKGDFGLITHDFAHRVHGILGDTKPVTLWIHGPRLHPVHLVGAGWGPREGEAV